MHHSSSLCRTLPLFDKTASQHISRVKTHLQRLIKDANGWLSFEQWMAQVLYAPGLGYYASEHLKFAKQPTDGSLEPLSGDFVTAAQLGPAFAQTLANQVEDILKEVNHFVVLEFGAGTGTLAADLLDTLDACGVNVTYQIIEVSAHLRALQQTHLARFSPRVQWLDCLPNDFCGCVIANEVLDAMPVTLFCWNDEGKLLERGVSLDANQEFVWADRPASLELTAIVSARLPPYPGYVSEINLQAEAWIRAMGDWLKHGAALLIDYGFHQSEYYHPQRSTGTLMCHLQHHAHADPFFAPGVQDITAHIDFSAIAQAAIEGNLDILGYTSQARFLLNSGLLEWVAKQPCHPLEVYTQHMSAVQKLISETEMGELFKVLALGKRLKAPLQGFKLGDRSHRLLNT